MAVRSAVMVLAFGVALLSWPLQSAAQQPGKIHKIGVLLAASPAIAAPWIVIGKSALREIGYVEGRNLAIEYRYASGQYDLLPVHAAELVKLNVDLIVALGDITIEAARQATRTTPIVMISGGDPVGAGFVASLAHPGGNVTGVASLIPDINPKMLSLLKEAVPRATRIGVLWNPASRGGVLGYKGMQEAARGLGVTLSSYETRRGVDFDGVFASMVKERTEAMVVLTDPQTFNQRDRIRDLAARNRIPAMYEIREFVDDGGLMAYGPSLAGMIQRSVFYVDKVLKGARPADLPVEQPTKFELVINRKALKALGLTLPQAVLLRADQVIE
ncbi:MAG: ABC transporter substrate-binding protein [Candidatus Rokubacteria bacterium]|nr:ABC transporter substrate-binding protein [Candidatus Rokubacteria bacterium]